MKAQDYTRESTRKISGETAESRISRAEALASLGIFELDMLSGKGNWSVGMYRLTGFDHGSSLPSVKRFLTWVYPADRPVFYKVIKEVLREGRIGFVEFRHEEANGRIRFFEGHVEPCTDEDGAVISVFGTMHEVAVRKLMGESLQINRINMQNTLDNLLEGCQIIGFDWRYRYLNKTAACYGKLPIDSYLGHTIMEIYPGFESTEMYRVLNDCMTNRLRQSAQFEFIYPDNTHSWFDFKIQPVPEGIFILSADITERKESEAMIGASELRYRHLFDNIAEGFALCRMKYAGDKPVDFMYLDVNETFTKLTGLSDVKGRWISEVIPGITKSDPELFDRFARVVMTGNPEKFEYYTEALRMWMSFSVYRPETDHFVTVFDVITDRKLVEANLEISRKRYHDLVETSPDAIWVNSDGRIDFVNSAAIRLFGANSAADLLGKGIFDVLHPESHPVVNDRINALRNGLSLPLAEEKIIRLDGTERYVESSAEVLAGEPGTAVQIVMRDITQRKMAEQALMESEARFRGLYDNTTIGLYRTTPDGKILIVNPAGLRQLGFTSMEEMNTRNLQENGFLPEYDRNDFVMTMEREGIITGLESRWRTKEGSFIDVRESAVAIRDVHGNIQYYDGTFEDITDRKRLEEQAYRWLQLFNDSDLCLAIADVKSNTFLQVNNSFARQRGYTPEELQGKPVFMIYPPDHLTGLKHQMVEIDRAGHGVFESVHVRKDGSLIPVLLDITINKGEDGIPTTRIAYCLDISHQKLLQDREKATLELLKICNHAVAFEDLMKNLMVFFRNFTGCDAVGVRLKDRNDFPYFNSLGFSPEFISSENEVFPAGPDDDNCHPDKPMYPSNCLCGMTLLGKTDPSKPYFTEHGSFWSGELSALLENPSAELPIKNESGCLLAGYESLALIPLKAPEGIIGLLQLDDKRKNHFTIEKVHILEQFVDYIALTMAKLLADEKVRQMNRHLEQRVQERTNELVQANVQLQEHANMIEDLYNNAPCGYHSLDKDGLVVSMNDTELKWLGLSRDDVVGKLNITSILTKESLGKFNALFPSFMLTGTIHDVELEFITCSGKILPVFVSETAIYDDSGTYVKSRSTVLDFTDVKQVREELIKKAYQLEDANHELEAFTYSVSHDLRAPLRAISGFTQILEQDFLPVLDEKGKNVVDTILQNTRRMYQLIDDLLAFSRVGRTTLQVTRVDMYDMAAECVEELTANIRVKPVVMVDSTLPVLLADRSLIRQVWLNLLANAIKFSSRNPSPVITISCSIIECYATFSVADNGVGFDMKYKDKLFGVFQRLHSQKEFEGTGVGLAIVQRIILRHGGTVWAESKPDMGAVFHFSLKINPDE